MADDHVQAVAQVVRDAASVVVTTGAGMSAESGVPTFRGPDGLWRSFRAADLATPQAFARDPRLVWEWYRWRRGLMRAAAPNPGHLALARLETRLADLQVITQNVDGLHRRAGTRRLLELHGNIWRASCWAGCGYSVDQTDAPIDEGTDGPEDGIAPARPLPTCRCGALLRPAVVWFGEALDPAVVDMAMSAAASCQVLLVVGTSSLVYPAAALPSVARRAGAVVVEINVDETPLSASADIVIRGPAGRVLPEVERWL